MGLENVVGQFVRRQFGGILRRSGLVGQLRLQLLDHGRGGEALAFAGFTQGASALTAKIDLESLKDTRASGSFGDEFANGAFKQRPSSSRTTSVRWTSSTAVWKWRTPSCAQSTD